MSDDDELARLAEQARRDRKLIRRAADALAEIDRGPGLSAVHADVLAALRIRLEGKQRASLEDLLTAAGDVGAGKDKGLGDVLSGGEGARSEWPAPDPKKKDWPGL